MRPSSLDRGFERAQGGKRLLRADSADSRIIFVKEITGTKLLRLSDNSHQTTLYRNITIFAVANP